MFPYACGHTAPATVKVKKKAKSERKLKLKELSGREIIEKKSKNRIMAARKPQMFMFQEAPKTAVESDQRTGKRISKELSSDSDSSSDHDSTSDDSSINSDSNSSECGGWNESPKGQSMGGIEDLLEMSSPTYEYSSGPMPSMPVYDEDTDQFKSPTSQYTGLSAGRVAEKWETPEEPVSDYEEDLNGFSDPSCDSDTPDDEEEDEETVHPFGQRKESWLKLPLGTGEVPFRFASSKKAAQQSTGSGSDYTDEEEAARSMGNEFYDDSASHGQDPTETLVFQAIKQEEIFEEYEQTFHAVRAMVAVVCGHLKYDIHQLLYPMLVLTYLQMVASDNVNGAMTFLKNCGKCLDDASYKSRLAKLMKILRPEEVPAKARLLLNGNEKVEIQMSRGAYMQCLLLLSRLPFCQQDKILGHFRIRMYQDEKLPQQRTRLGHPRLDIMLWTVPGKPGERPKISSPAAGSGRRRKREFAAHTNANMPPRQQLYTPPPSLKDEIKRRTHEQQREALGREHLPSVYLYTAMAGQENIICADFSVNFDMVALGTNASLVHVFSVDAAKKLEDMTLDTGRSDKRDKRILYGHQGAVYGCAFSPDDRYLLSCSRDSDVRLWCLRSWHCLVIYEGHQSPVFSVVFAPLGFYFATGSADGTARVWAQNLKKSARLFSGHLASVEVCLFHPNRYYLATGSSDCTVRLWDIVKGHQVRLLSGHAARIPSLAFSKCGRFLASGGGDNLVIVWDLPRERMIRCLSHHTAAIYSCDFDMNNNLLVVGSRDGRLSIWDFDRLVQESGRAHKNSPSRRPTEELLLKSYANDEGAIYKVSFTSGNLMFGVRLESTKKSEDRAGSEHGTFAV
ncbi:transcription initiation factor TFIID subunit 5 [Drosophila obscura]|uniref:transcription initiation factor TFIID subunit 5 n=1 Tax=Drosophila obscura TaxID=7282 RepID=UPI001BB22601|nr:transcription initiation factor TFIID subunit 5 [Drosophila obscura]